MNVQIGSRRQSGEIAARIIRTLKRLDVEAIGMASDSDRLRLRCAWPTAYCASGLVVWPRPTSISMQSWRQRAANGVHAVHPGYGFLSESAEFADRLWPRASHSSVQG